MGAPPALRSALASWEASTAPPAVAEVGAREAGLRLAPFAAAAFSELGSTSQAKREAKAGRLTLNGWATEPARRLRQGDVLVLRAPPSRTHEAREATLRLAARMIHDGYTTLYEDDEMAVVHKPAGVHSKPYRGAAHLEAALPALLGAPSGAPDVLPAPLAVHRLDARVCGLLLVGKTRSAVAHLAGELAARRARKRYRALLLGPMLDGLGPSCTDCEWLRPLGRELDLRALGEVAEGEEEEEASGVASCAWAVSAPIGGRASLSEVHVVEETPHVQAGALTTVDMVPCTGRRHQLRIHAAALGHPILGDDLYGMPGLGAGSHLYLQSVEVRVRHPSGGGGGADGFVHVRVPEAARFARRRERARMGWEYEQRLAAASEPSRRAMWGCDGKGGDGGG